ncbi:MAG: PEP-CTERM sorting domain-containing protein [Planctomycetales bacterium]|nr:PEP-CTERM sorting domain-containing protein [Planctomycetales bacterium]
MKAQNSNAPTMATVIFRSGIYSSRSRLQPGKFLAIAILFATATPSRADLIINGSFESTNSSDYQFGMYNDRTGTWGADLASVVQAENGIMPLDGTQMLKFLGTGLNGSTNGVFSEVSQLVEVGAGQLLEASAMMNRVNVSDADSRMGIGILAYSGLVQDHPANVGSALAQSVLEFTTDADLSTWEPISTQLLTPAGTDYVEVYVFAVDSPNNAPPNEFRGNYADSVRLTAVPEPSSALMLPIAGSLFAFFRRRRSTTAVYVT